MLVLQEPLNPLEFRLHLNRFTNGIRSQKGKNTVRKVEQKKIIYDTLLEHSQVTMDRKNSRDMVLMSKEKYLKLYGRIETEKLFEVTNKHGKRLLFKIC